MEHFSSQPNRESEEIDDSRQLKNITADSGVLDINPESSTSVGPISNIPDFLHALSPDFYIYKYTLELSCLKQELIE